MNGLHDMGGQQCFGAVVQEVDEPLFHAAWERRVLALTLAMGASGQWNLDMSRFVRESLPADIYLGGSYYRIWLEALLRLLQARGLVTSQELENAEVRAPRLEGVRTLAAEQVLPLFGRGWPSTREAAAPARFGVGEVVHTVQHHPGGHTRLPRYARGRCGTVVAVHGVHVFPDAHAAGQGEQPQWLYSVRFEARELWGTDTTADAVYLDCWESYLLPCSPAADTAAQDAGEAAPSAMTPAQAQAALRSAGLTPLAPPETLAEVVSAQLRALEVGMARLAFDSDHTAFTAALAREARQ